MSAPGFARAFLATATLACLTSSLAAQRWCYRALERPGTPPGTATNPIDRFIESAIEARGLRANPPATRAALLRRVHYDLTGLPPSPEEVAAFLADERPDAYARRVDALLASEQYGVHQARRWLDLVRWAETDSYERDRNKPGAWLYRDWVVDAMNRDMPYDRFLRAQLAGDEFPNATMADRIATGYLHLGIRDDEPTDPLQAVYDDFDGMADTTARVMLGISMGCARCHDHKRDPLPTRDYYRFLAFFETLKPYKRGGGNAITMRNFVRVEGIDDGPDGNVAREAAWKAERAELVRRIRARASRVTSSSDPNNSAAAPTTGLVADHSALDVGQEGGLELSGPAQLEDEGGKYLRFDGRDDWGRIPRPVADDFTIAFRFRSEHASSGAGRYRWHHGDGLVDGEIPGIVRDFGTSWLAGGRVSAGCGQPEVSIVSEPGYDDGDWHTVAFTRERRTGRIVLWMDGTRSAEARASKAALDMPKELRLGRLANTNHFFQGDLGDVRIWNRVLDDREILALSLGAAAAEALDSRIEQELGEAERRAMESDLARYAKLAKPKYKTRTFLCAKENGPTPSSKSFVRVRGNANAKGEEVRPGFPTMLGAASDVELSELAGPTAHSAGRRLALARWITSEDNPLTASVIANRIWQQHFGRGIVRTPNEFGKLGALPTHPKLLDWLACELKDDGWSLKSLRRKILLSRAYRRSSHADASMLAEDPQNDGFWRFDPRRLTAEEIRDSILHVNGTINLAIGGPSVYPRMPAEVLATASRPDAAWGRSSASDAARRSLYIFVKRSLLMPFLTGFDLADTDSSCPVRFVTTQSTQALTMINGAFLHEESAKLARRLERAREGTDARLARGLELITQRRALPREIERARRLYDALLANDGLDPSTALSRVCLVFYNLNEFLYVD